MQCVEVAEQLLAPDDGAQQQIEQHLAGCVRCATLARRLSPLDRVLRSAMVTEPPAELQQQLHELSQAAARPRRSWWLRLQEQIGALVMARPALALGQGLAALVLVLGGWQALSDLTTFTPVLGDVPYAFQLVAASPATGYLSGLQIDLQSLGLWSLVGLAGWLISENGPVRSR